MIKNINGIQFKYEKGKIYRLHKTQKIWLCCNDNKINNKGQIKIVINGRLFYLQKIIEIFENSNTT